MSSRKGQKSFRNKTIRGAKCCEATLSQLITLTDACHIKPHNICSNEEKNDPNNSILLLASVHRAFDAGLISFDDRGYVIISNEIDEWEMSCLGLSGKEQISMPGKRKEYLKFHRENIFKK